MTEETTCGKGLAEHSALPRSVAAFAAAMAEMLEHHRTSLDAGDAGARPELDAYTTLAHDFRSVAAMLETIGSRMAGYRDLPMANHDVAALMNPEATAAFEAFVRAERELLRLLETSVQRDEAMLAAMRR
jgi:hypothetical protein